MRKLINFITLEEYNKLMKAEKNKYYRVAYMLMFGSGLRLSEVVGSQDGKIKPLQPNQINFDSHQIKVFGKGSKERITMMPKPMKEEHIKLLPLKINRRTLQYHLKILGRKTLKKEIHPHMLRHGFANHFVNEKNTPLPYMQSFLGHSRLDTTGIYTKANPKIAVDSVWESA